MVQVSRACIVVQITVACFCTRTLYKWSCVAHAVPIASWEAAAGFTVARDNRKHYAHQVANRLVRFVRSCIGSMALHPLPHGTHILFLASVDLLSASQITLRCPARRHHKSLCVVRKTKCVVVVLWCWV